MYSAKNSLKVFVSTYTGPTNQPTLGALEAGAMGFYDEAGNLATSGAGYIHYKKPNGQVVKSRKFDSFPGWGGTQSFASPMNEIQQVTIPSATAGAYYQATLTVYPIGVGGAVILHGNYTAKTGDTAVDIATGLATSLQNALDRMGYEDVEVNNTSDVLSAASNFPEYIVGRKNWRPARFKLQLTSPEDVAANAAVTTAYSEGIGHGPAILENEMFAKGYSERFREAGWPNSYGLSDLVADASKNYDVLTLNLAIDQDTANGNKVTTSETYILAFDNAGTTPPAAP